MLLTENYPGEQIKKNEVGGSCDTFGGKRGAYRILVQKREGERDHLEDVVYVGG